MVATARMPPTRKVLDLCTGESSKRGALVTRHWGSDRCDYAGSTVGGFAEGPRRADARYGPTSRIPGAARTHTASPDAATTIEPLPKSRTASLLPSESVGDVWEGWAGTIAKSKKDVSDAEGSRIRYPMDWLLAVSDDPKDAREAAASLVAAGVGVAQVKVLDGATAEGRCPTYRRAKAPSDSSSDWSSW
jgi:hypothetical protein